MFFFVVPVNTTRAVLSLFPAKGEGECWKGTDGDRVHEAYIAYIVNVSPAYYIIRTQASCKFLNNLSNCLSVYL